MYFQVTLLPQVLTEETDYSVEIQLSRAISIELPHNENKIEYEELLTPDQYSEFKYSVVKSGILTTPKNKWQYILSEIHTEFGFKAYKHAELYITIIILLLTIWISRYIHYTGQ